MNAVYIFYVTAFRRFASFMFFYLIAHAGFMVKWLTSLDTVNKMPERAFCEWAKIWQKNVTEKLIEVLGILCRELFGCCIGFKGIKLTRPDNFNALFGKSDAGV